MILMPPSGKLAYPRIQAKLTTRATTAQASVNAIRAAGAKTQMIALPGTFWQHPEAYTDGRNDPILVSCFLPFGSKRQADTYRKWLIQLLPIIRCWFWISINTSMEMVQVNLGNVPTSKLLCPDDAIADIVAV
jgi:hypothetical protein